MIFVADYMKFLFYRAHLLVSFFLSDTEIRTLNTKRLHAEYGQVQSTYRCWYISETLVKMGESKGRSKGKSFVWFYSNSLSVWVDTSRSLIPDSLYVVGMSVELFSGLFERTLSRIS